MDFTGQANNSIGDAATYKMQDKEKKVKFWMFWKQRRYFIGILIFCGSFLSYNFRVNLNVAIVKMTENRTIIDANGTVCYKSEFDWDSKQKGFILSAFFYGYMSTQMLAGWLAARFGGKWVLGSGMAVAACLALLTPLVVRFNPYLFIVLRVVQGAFEGLLFPSTLAMWAHWAPPMERSKLSGLGFSGSYVGTLVSLPVCGIIAERINWSSIFYIFGTIGIVWYICWMFFVADRPEEDPRISSEELQYIQESIGSAQTSKKLTYPWKQIFCSVPVWAIYSSHIVEAWGYSTMMTQLPIFMNDVLHLDLELAGIYSALPYATMTVMLLFSGFTADYLLSRKILSTTWTRKILNIIGFVGQSIFIALAAWFIVQPEFVIPSIILSVGFSGIAWMGFFVNYLDIAPQYASVISGIGNTLGCIPAIISPITVGYIVQNKSAEEWRVVFLTICVISVFGFVIYAIFASGELQPWAIEKKQDSNTNHDNSSEK